MTQQRVRVDACGILYPLPSYILEIIHSFLQGLHLLLFHPVRLRGQRACGLTLFWDRTSNGSGGRSNENIGVVKDIIQGVREKAFF